MSLFCPTCNKYAPTSRYHQCSPTWHVWLDGEEEGFDPADARTVYADDAHAAALEYADVHYGSDPQELDLHVRPTDGGPVSRYKLDYYVQPVYSAYEAK